LKGIEIVDKIYTITSSFPKDEIYGIVTQMIKAAVSIPSNIAEGFSRHYRKEFKQFLYVLLGSCAELETQLIISHRRNYVNDSEFKELTEDINHESRMLSSLINKF